MSGLLLKKKASNGNQSKQDTVVTHNDVKKKIS